MASGKKGKKKWMTVDLSNVPSISIPRKTTSWADDPELENIEHDNSRKLENISLPTAPRAARIGEEDAKIPHEPPFLAFVTNIPYDVNPDELQNFIQGQNNRIKINSISMPREERSNKYKGFAYIDFPDRESFVTLMHCASDITIRGRRIRIDVSSGRDGDRRGGRGSSGPEPDYMTRDWRAGGPTNIPEREDDNYKRRNYDDRGGGGSYGRRGGYGDRDRDRGGFNRNRDDERERSSAPGSWLEEKERSGNFNRRNYDDRRNNDGGGGGGSSSSGGSWRRSEDYSRDNNRDNRSPEHRREISEPKSRPKINLKPRTKPLEEDKELVKESASSAIFGGAKPVNTAAREREIEERLAKQSSTQDDFPKRRGAQGQSDRGYKSRDDYSRERGKNRDEHRSKDGSECELDRKSEYDDRDSQTDRTSSRDGEFEDELPRKLEPAPPPKENVWAVRSQLSSTVSVQSSTLSVQSSTASINNGQASPSEVELPKKSESTTSTKETASQNDIPTKKYQAPRGNATDRTRDRRANQNDDRNKNSLGTGKGSNSSVSSKSSSQATPRSRDIKKEEKDIRIPKFEEQKAPNFAGSNKFAFLDETNETAAN